VSPGRLTSTAMKYSRRGAPPRPIEERQEIEGRDAGEGPAVFELQQA
jgi:hypothetical protein